MGDATMDKTGEERVSIGRTGVRFRAKVMRTFSLQRSEAANFRRELVYRFRQDHRR